MATGFRHVHAYALAVDAPGSIDVAMLYDSPQNGVFYVTPTYARLSSGSTYYNRALYFAEINAYATDRVYRDSVYFFDSRISSPAPRVWWLPDFLDRIGDVSQPED